MSAGGITLEGITNSHGLLIDIQRAMIRAARKVIFCLDHTKFGRRSVLPLCGLDSIDTIVTDSQAPQELVEQLRDRGMEVIIAPANGTVTPTSGSAVSPISKSAWPSQSGVKQVWKLAIQPVWKRALPLEHQLVQFPQHMVHSDFVDAIFMSEDGESFPLRTPDLLDGISP